MSNLREVTMLTKEKNGTGRFVDSVERGVVCLEEVSLARQFTHAEWGICTLVILKNGMEVKVTGGIDALFFPQEEKPDHADS